MCDLISLPQELIMHTIVTYLGLNDSIRFIQTCKTLYDYTEVKAFWIHLVHCALRLRPIPLSTDWSRNSIEKIRDHVKSACELTRMMGQRSLPPPKKICTLEAQGTGGLQWAWILRDGNHLITVSDDWIWRLWNVDSKEVLATIQLEGEISCCDWTQKPDALTIIINNRNQANDLAMCQIWRYQWVSKSFEKLVCREFPGDLFGNFARGDIMGHITRNVTGEYFVYVLDIVTLKEARITLDIASNMSLFQSALTTPTSLFFYSETTTSSLYYSLSLEELAAQVASPMKSTSLQPSIIWLFQFDPTEITEIAPWWNPRCRYLWDGRIGVFSHTGIPSQLVTLSLINPKPPDLADMPPAAAMNTLPVMIAPAHRVLLRQIPDDEGIVYSAGGWKIWFVGIFAKGVAWLEYRTGSSPEFGDQAIGKICFAEFPPMEDETQWKLEKVVSGDQDGTDMSVVDEDRESLHSDDHSEKKLWPTRSSSILSTAGTENTPDNADQQVSERSGFGHVAEYTLEDGWADEYEGIYSMDYDDARGRVVFATGSGKVLIYDFL